MHETSSLIVILEDDTGLRRAIERLLRLSGFSTQTFDNAEDPDVLAYSSSAYCLVLDVQLPGLSGPAFYMSLPQPRPPVVFITAFDGPVTRHTLLGSGDPILLNKPFLGQDLLAAVDRATHHRP